MWKACPALFAAAVAAALLPSPARAAELSPTETRWLQGAAPVIHFAREAGLPLDVVVQPQPTPGNAPLGLAFVNGRCKLVLSMRGNAEAEATLARIEPALLDATLELMAAHELGHCRRYLDGAWYGVPAGFAASRPPEGLSRDLQSAYAEMKAVRREEGYGDLVGLAWTRRHRPAQYAALHAWLVRERSPAPAGDALPGSHHDTLAWVVLARQGSALVGSSIFEAAGRLWSAGLALPD